MSAAKPPNDNFFTTGIESGRGRRRQSETRYVRSIRAPAWFSIANKNKVVFRKMRMKSDRIGAVEWLMMLAEIEHNIRSARVAICRKRIKLPRLFEDEKLIGSWQHRDVHWICESKFRVNSLNAEWGRGIGRTNDLVCGPRRARCSKDSNGEANQHLDEIPKGAPRNGGGAGPACDHGPT